ncbi:MAG: exodeoxyribonuclease VII large subunit [Thermodesulfovibrio sp.]|nr:exodeoxyribonuclease VII large subunit [Thermodesulfovibrio sp.]
MQTYSLFELNAAVRETLELTFPEAVWVVAEIAEARSNPKGHCYLELVEKRDNAVIAQIKANIWSYTYRSLAPRFERDTGEKLRAGMQVLLSVNVTFHEVYGLSLNIRDIDPTYSLGEMARRKRETIERLKKEGLTDLNKALSLPLVPQRIAVISSAAAAGYGDFINQLNQNPDEYKIYHELFQATLQGNDAEASILASLAEIRKRSAGFDAVVIIRGGGSQLDLSCFDGYSLAAEVARFPLPVITGIGHERDDTVMDIVAHTKMKTPTAVAEFLLSGMRAFEDRLLSAQRTLADRAKGMLREEGHRLKILAQQVSHLLAKKFHDEHKRLSSITHGLKLGTGTVININRNRLSLSITKLGSGVKGFLHARQSSLNHLEQAVRLLDPSNVLKRGYSITYHRSRAVKDASAITRGDVITTRLYHGSIISTVEENDAQQGTDLFKSDN